MTDTESTEAASPEHPPVMPMPGLRLRVLPPVVLGRTWRIVERNTLAYRRRMLVLVAALVEPILFLLSIGIGVGALVGDLPGPNGDPVRYESFVAPGLLAAAAMNGAIFESTFNFFIKFKYMKTYDGILSTPLTPTDTATGEILFALLRGLLASTVFLVTMAVLGYIESPLAVFVLPVTVLIGASFGAVGLAASTYMRSYVDFDYVNLAVIPLFLFSATFFPVTQYPKGVQVFVEWTPLYQGVELCRALTLGQLHIGLLTNIVYMLVMVVVGVSVGSRRLGTLLQP
ncbi:MAG TPA: ABC transporter permease [Acidimicrobiales bacterium]|nr:ABC transporter permease [Acidimicrobiales bacterium]